ncbi:hypothetical protein HDZ31DRAFT_61903 [Schizophyllum fasciatum]
MLKGTGSRSSPIELSDDEDMRAPPREAKASTTTAKPARNNAHRQGSPMAGAARSKSAKRKREEEHPDAFVPRPAPKATSQAPGPAEPQAKQKNKKKANNKQSPSSKQQQHPSSSSQAATKPRTIPPAQASAPLQPAVPPHMDPPPMPSPAMVQGQLIDAPFQSGWVNAMLGAAKRPISIIHHTLSQMPDIEMHDPIPSTSYVPPPALVSLQRPAPAAAAVATQTRSKTTAPASAPAPANVNLKKQRGRPTNIGYEPDPDPKSEHGTFPAEAYATLAPWTPDPTRTLIMESIPKIYRGNPDWVANWALSVCGAAPLVVSNKLSRDRALIEFPSNALAQSAWLSRRLCPELDRMPSEQLKGQPRLDFIRVYWMTVDGVSPGFDLAQRRQLEVQTQPQVQKPAQVQTPAQAQGHTQAHVVENGDALHASSSKTSRKRRPPKHKAEADRPRSPSPLPMADPTTPAHSQAATQGPHPTTGVQSSLVKPTPQPSALAQSQPPPTRQQPMRSTRQAQAGRQVDRQPSPSLSSLRSSSPLSIAPPLELDMKDNQTRLPSSVADSMMVSPARSMATCSPVDPIVIDVDQDDSEAYRMQSLEPGEIPTEPISREHAQRIPGKAETSPAGAVRIPSADDGRGQGLTPSPSGPVNNATVTANAAVTPEPMTRDKAEEAMRELKARVRESRRKALQAAPAARPPLPKETPRALAVTTSFASQSSQTKPAQPGQGSPSTAATVEDDAEMFIKMAISEESTQQPPPAGFSPATMSVQSSTFQKAVVEEKTIVTQDHRGAPPPPPLTREELLAKSRRINERLAETRHIMALLSAAKTPSEREHAHFLWKELDRKYGPVEATGAGTSATTTATTTQQAVVSQQTVFSQPKPRRKWPAPEQGPVIIEISDDEVE